MDEFIKKAEDFYKRHIILVNLMLYNKNVKEIKPSYEDINHPELWKDIHWSWYFENYKWIEN